MRGRRIVAVLALVCGVWSAAVCQAADPPVHKAKVLFLTQSKGFRHGSVKRPDASKSANSPARSTDSPRTLAPAEIAMTQLGQATNLFDVHCTQDATADFTEANLKNYDIVMLYTTGDLPIFAADYDYFNRKWLTQKGHGVVGFHSATDTFHEFEPYWDMLGGTFNGHPWGSRTKVTITVHDTSHPASRPFGKEFEIRDEIYQYKHWQPAKVHVLMSLSMEKCKPQMPYQVPIAWVKNYGDGKIFYTNLGHNEATWTDKRFLASVEGGVRWVLNKETGDATPNPEVSKAEDEKSRAAAKAGNHASTPAKDRTLAKP